MLRPMFLLTFSIAVTDEQTRLARVETALFCHGAARGAAGGPPGRQFILTAPSY